MKRLISKRMNNTLFGLLLVSTPMCINAQETSVVQKFPKPTVDVEVKSGPYNSTWESLSQWECPEWFRDAKFGIWAHWGPQCQAEYGDWYGRRMYFPGHWQYNHHVNTYGSPADYGLKELIRDWKAANWNPEELVKLYKEVGARYFFTIGQHHDNFDLWDSPYQEWNSVNLGPQRDIVGEWAKACEKYGLPMGISFHGSHTWTWMEGSQAFDGNLTLDDGAGKWWEGYDPQELYAQRHEPSVNWNKVDPYPWAWGANASSPSEEYKQKFKNRVLQSIDTYNPKIVYYDDIILPFNGCDDDFGLDLLKHYYNKGVVANGSSETDVVATGKILGAKHKEAMLWDVERGIPNDCQPLPWQTCTCIGDWHYDRPLYERGGYKSASLVVRMLVDIVSKNGNLLLSIPIRADGTIDEKERAILKDIKAWMDINKESIYDTRPWKTYGEGPMSSSNANFVVDGFNENFNYSAEDVRYAEKNGVVYATIMCWPSSEEFTFNAFSVLSPHYSGKVTSVKLLGYGDVKFAHGENGLSVEIPKNRPNPIAPVFEIQLNDQTDEKETFHSVLDLVATHLDEYIKMSSDNTGKYSPYAVDKLYRLVETIKQDEEMTDEYNYSEAIDQIRVAYNNLLAKGKKQGGVIGRSEGQNVTNQHLVQSTKFSAKNMGSRFGTPINWTVENYSIPQLNSSAGVKNGIDNAPGVNCLNLGVWAGEDGTTTSDLQNARIYRTVTLPAGTYFFGATYNNTFQLNDHAYIFATKELCTTDELPQKSMAYYQINAAVDRDGKYYGIEFTLDEESNIMLGWQADLTRGTNQQEFRADNVQLLYYGAEWSDNFEALLQEVEVSLELAEASTGTNTGKYKCSAVEELRHYYSKAIDAKGSDSQTDKYLAYVLLKSAYEYFGTEGCNPGGNIAHADAKDITIEHLKESDSFSATNMGNRFGSPSNWTVENYNIPQKNANAGTKAGIDTYSGFPCLYLGVWADEDEHTSSDLSNARLFQTLTLPKGKYFFGASFHHIHQLNEAYIFASEETLNTDDMKRLSVAHYDIMKCKTDGNYYGIEFTLDEEKTLFLGFQADLNSGSSTQEFRVSGVRLLQYNEAPPTAIMTPEVSERKNSTDTNVVYFSLSGQRIASPPSKGFFIEHDGGKSTIRYGGEK